MFAESEDGNDPFDEVCRLLKLINRTSAEVPDENVQKLRDLSISLAAAISRTERRIARGMPEDEIEEMAKIDLIDVDVTMQRALKVLAKRGPEGSE
jgi:hypothetical protein